MSAALPLPSLPRADALRDRYLLERELGRGGMATVFLARDLRHDRAVAFKLMHPEYVAGVGAARFRQEIRLAAGLAHPHIVPVFDSGELDGRLWFTMPRINGPTLRQVLQQSGPLPLERALGILEPVARALAYAHRQGVVHRDLKPENVLLDQDGVYLADFGVARPMAACATVTTPGVIVGTPAYMAPEQFETGVAVDPRADLYAFGVLAYELLAGRPPFAGRSPALLIVAHATETPEPIARQRPDIPGSLAMIISKCLRKLPAERWESAAVIAAMLRAVPGRSPGLPDVVATPVDDSGEATGRLERARTAFNRTAWHEAYDELVAADSDGTLDPEDLERLAEAAWWISNGQASLRARERAYRRYLERGDRAASASMAIVMAEDHFHRRNRAVGQGWLRRAERDLDALPTARERGWLYRLKLVLALDAENDPARALDLAGRALEIAHQSGDRDLAALALQDQGRILIAMGRVDEGMALLDEAMTAVSAGELSPRTTGRIYCNLISTCERVGDVRRAAEWHAIAEAWSEPHLGSGFPGMCRVYRAGILRRRGALDDAKREAGRAAEELSDFLVDLAGEAFYELGEVHRERGELADADRMFREAHARGREPQPGLALVRLAEGNTGDADMMIQNVLRDSARAPLDRIRLLPAAVEIATAAGDIAGATDAVAELEQIVTTWPSPAFNAQARVARGQLALLRRKPSEAVAQLRAAIRTWTELDLPVELARTRLLLARVFRAMAHEADAELEERAAEAAYARLGVNPAQPVRTPNRNRT